MKLKFKTILSFLKETGFLSLSNFVATFSSYKTMYCVLIIVFGGIKESGIGKYIFYKATSLTLSVVQFLPSSLCFYL